MYPSARTLGLNVVRSAGDEEYLLCPFHNDSKPSASFNRRLGLFHCYVCDLGLNLFQLCGMLGLERVMVEEFAPSAEPEEFCLIKETETLNAGIKDYHPYFEKRGVGKETACLYDLHWDYAEPQAAVLPITNLNGKTIGAQYRYLDAKAAGTRYKTRGQTTPVWPMHLLRGREVNMFTPMFVTEGAWSAMKLHSWFCKAPYMPVVFLALLGAKANQAIVDTLRPFNVVFLYDGDEAGIRACRKMRKLWSSTPSWTLSKSPDDMEGDEIENLFQKIAERIET